MRTRRLLLATILAAPLMPACGALKDGSATLQRDAGSIDSGGVDSSGVDSSAVSDAAPETGAADGSDAPSDSGSDAEVGPDDARTDGPTFPERPIGPGLGAYAITPSGANATPQLWTRPLVGANPKWQWIADVPNAVSAPTSVSWSRMRTDVFYTTSAGTLAHAVTNDFGRTYARFNDTALPGYRLTGRPDSTSWAEGRIDVACIAQPVAGGPQVVLHGTFNDSDGQNSDWETWGWPEDDGATLIPQSNATILSWSVGRLDVFVVGSDGQPWHKYLDGKTSSTPSDWESFPNDGLVLGYDLDGVSMTDSRIDLFTTGIAGQGTGKLAHWFWPGGSWAYWPDAPSVAVTAQLGPFSVARTGTDGMDLTAVDSSSPPLVWRMTYRSGLADQWTSFEPPPAMPAKGIVEVTAWL